MPKASINGIDLHYQRVGAGPEIVLLHGLTANLAFWHPAIVHGLAADHAVTLVDLRGHGRSALPATGYTTREHAEDVAGLLDHLGVDRAVVVGHSYGGAVALALAVAAPSRVRGLGLADARVPELQPRAGIDVWEHWPAIRDRLQAHGITVDARDVERELGLLEALARLRVAGRLDGIDLRPFFVPFAGGSRRPAERWLELLRDTTAAAELWRPAGLTRAAIAGVSAPALLAFGELSHCRPTQVELERLLPHARSVVIPGVGHFHPLLRPEAFRDALLRFADELGLSGHATREPAGAARAAD